MFRHNPSLRFLRKLLHSLYQFLGIGIANGNWRIVGKVIPFAASNIKVRGCFRKSFVRYFESGKSVVVVSAL